MLFFAIFVSREVKTNQKRRNIYRGGANLPFTPKGGTKVLKQSAHKQTIIVENVLAFDQSKLPQLPECGVYAL